MVDPLPSLSGETRGASPPCMSASKKGPQAEGRRHGSARVNGNPGGPGSTAGGLAPPPGHGQRGPAPAPPPPQTYWYYCPSANAYYPNAATCPEAWIKVPPRPQ